MSPELDYVCYVCTFLGIAIVLNIILLVLILAERKSQYQRNKKGLSEIYETQGSAAFLQANSYSPEARIRFLREKVRDQREQLDAAAQKSILNTLTVLHDL